jgi:Stress responsive A/B Barrel Domain
MPSSASARHESLAEKGHAMILHSVMFWLHEDIRGVSGPRDKFMAGCRALARAPGVSRWALGTPAATRRALVDWSYDVALTLIFEGLAEHDVYQASQEHLNFKAQFDSYYHRAIVYDLDVSEGNLSVADPRLNSPGTGSSEEMTR